jgi:hypothetical protein
MMLFEATATRINQAVCHDTGEVVASIVAVMVNERCLCGCLGVPMALDAWKQSPRRQKQEDDSGFNRNI